MRHVCPHCACARTDSARLFIRSAFFFSFISKLTTNNPARTCAQLLFFVLIMVVTITITTTSGITGRTLVAGSDPWSRSTRRNNDITPRSPNYSPPLPQLSRHRCCVALKKKVWKEWLYTFSRCRGETERNKGRQCRRKCNVTRDLRRASASVAGRVFYQTVI